MDEMKKTAIERWLIKAEHDLQTTRTMLEVNPPVTDIVCFHAQQCAEKCLKAFLVFVDVHVEKTHYLPRLVELCSQIDPDFGNFSDMAAELTDYAVEGRYPDDWRDITADEAIKAKKKAEKIMAFVRQKLISGGV
jgi:HEPN domain-containing protein